MRVTPVRRPPAAGPLSSTVVAEALAVGGLSSDGLELCEVVADTHRRRLLGPAGSVVLDVAMDDDGRRLNRLEVAGRRWAVQAGVAVPEVLGAAEDGSWVLGRQAAPVRAASVEVVREAVALSLAVAAGTLPVLEPVRTWRAPRRTAVLRAGRLARARMPMRAFLTARAAAAALPNDAVAHGDFHLGNVLELDGRLVVVDWEFLAPAPVGTDALRLWATLEDPKRREEVRLLLHDAVPPSAHGGLEVLARWLVLRSLAEAASEPVPAEREAALLRARSVYEATLAADAWPGPA